MFYFFSRELCRIMTSNIRLMLAILASNFESSWASSRWSIRSATSFLCVSSLRRIAPGPSPPPGGRRFHYHSSRRHGLGTRVSWSDRNRFHTPCLPGSVPGDSGSARCRQAGRDRVDHAGPYLTGRLGLADRRGLTDRTRTRTIVVTSNPGHGWGAGKSGLHDRPVPSQWDMTGFRP